MQQSLLQKQQIVRPAAGRRAVARGRGRQGPLRISNVAEMERTSDLSGSGPPSPTDAAGVKQDILLQAKYTVGAPLDRVTPKEAYQATAYSAAERLIECVCFFGKGWQPPPNPRSLRRAPRRPGG